MELIEGSETLAISIVMPGNYPKENRLQFIFIKLLSHPSDFSSNHIIQQFDFLFATKLNIFPFQKVINSYHNLAMQPGNKG